MITLYHCVSARSFRVLWMLEELRTPYALKMLPFPPRRLEKSFVELNPTGTVPFLIDGDTRMAESAAICEYLAARHVPTPLQVEAGEADFGAYLEYLHFGEATLTFPQALILRYSRFEPAARRQPQVVEDYGRWFLGRLRTLEPRLSTHDYLCAGRFTAADVCVGYALLLAEHLGFTSRFAPPILAYWERIKRREAFVRALDVQGREARAQGVSTVPVPDMATLY